MTLLLHLKSLMSNLFHSQFLIDQIFEYLDKDLQLKEDLSTYDIMFNNRELAVNKIELKSWK